MGRTTVEEAEAVGTNGPCAAAQVAGRGVGLLATRLIQSGELILAERPVLVVEGTEDIRRQVASEHLALADSCSTAGMRRMNGLFAQDVRLAKVLECAFHEVSTTRRELFLQLSDSFDDNCGSLNDTEFSSALGGRFLTNAVGR